ncbi:AMP-binding protein, partial [Parafrankia sp. FMc6]|uniref:AMP-binding protein n=1 Tax=Parafrankia soli TaxID=2599596 RepID=UPI0034D3FD6C
MTTVRTARPDDQAGSGGECQPGAEPEPGVPRAPADARGRAAGRFAHSLVWEQARARPHQVALRADGERDRTYADLRHASARLAARLVEAGVGPDDTVAVLMERSADVVVAMLAILDAGGAYAAVDRRVG